MASASFPVELLNAGQVLACMGFLEAADALCGPAEGGFEWPDRHISAGTFTLHTTGPDNPVAHVLEYLATADITATAPTTWAPAEKKQGKGKGKGKTGNDDDVGSVGSAIERTHDSPAAELGDMALPVLLGGGNQPRIRLGHWADGSSRDDFKLYSGNRSAFGIARTMLQGKVTAKGRVQMEGIRQMWRRDPEVLTRDPLGTTVPMGGSFNLDARCAWTALDAGYSPDAHDQKVLGSPVVEMLAAWGLENARPCDIEYRTYRYGVWRGLLPPLLARPALAAQLAAIECRTFRVLLGVSGKNKVVGYAQEES